MLILLTHDFVCVLLVIVLVTSFPLFCHCFILLVLHAFHIIINSYLCVTFTHFPAFHKIINSYLCVYIHTRK